MTRATTKRRRTDVPPTETPCENLDLLSVIASPKYRALAVLAREVVKTEWAKLTLQMTHARSNRQRRVWSNRCSGCGTVMKLAAALNMDPRVLKFGHSDEAVAS